MYRKLASAVLIAAAMNAKYAAALGLGDMTMHSALNQPLNAEIKLTNVGDLDSTQVLVSLAGENAFAVAGVERTYFITGMKFEVILDENGQGVIKLSSSKNVKEPFLDFLLEAKWPAGRVVKSYTALIDLPVYTEKASEQVDLGTPAISATTTANDEQEMPSSEEVSAEQVSSVDVSNDDAAEVVEPEAVAEPFVESSYQEESSSYSDDSYTIVRGDTLYRVARTVNTASDVSVEQTMLALQQQNPHAFIGGNVNRIKAGAVLRVPTSSEIRETSARSAMAAIGQQNREWREAQLESTEEHYAPTPSVDDEQGHLSLASAGTGLANGSDAEGESSAASAANAEALEVANQENKELEGRVQSLDNQITDLQRMIELKDAELANLQQQFSKNAQAEPEESVVEPVVDTPAAEVSATDIMPEPEVTEEAATASESDPMAEKAAEEAAEVEPVEEEVVKEVPKPAAPVVDAEEDIVAQLLSNPMYLGIAGLLIGFIVVLLVMRKRGSSEDDISNFVFDEALEPESADEPTEESEDEVAVQEEESELEESQDLEVEEESAAPTTMQTGDAISEADIYIAYGRYDQAIELLENAIAGSSEDVSLRSKLLEVYVESNDKPGFQNHFAQLQTLADEDAIIQAKELLSAAGDKADWLQDIAEPGAAEDEMSSSVSETIEDLESLDADLSLDEDFDLESDLSVDVEPESVDEEISLDLDEDFSLDMEEEVSQDEPEEALLDSVDESLDLDLSMLDETEVAVDEPVADDLDDDLSLDLSGLDETMLDMPAVADESAAESEEDLLDLDSLDLDLGLDVEPQAAVEPEDELSLDGDFDLSLSNDLELSEEDAPVEEAPVTEATSEDAPIEEPSALAALEGDDLAFLTDADEVSTKLDLARAYVDMGDVDGARDILMEVMKEGSDEQKTEATALIDGLD